jgi:hypothetical protein
MTIDALVDYPDTTLLRSLECPLKLLQVQRDMMQPFAMTRDEPANKVIANCTKFRGLNEFELKSGDIELSQHEVAARTAHRLGAHHASRKIALKERERAVDIAHRQRGVIQARSSILLWKARLIIIGTLQELNYRAKGRARGHKSGAPTALKLLFLDDSHPVRTHSFENRLEVIDFE